MNLLRGALLAFVVLYLIVDLLVTIAAFALYNYPSVWSTDRLIENLWPFNIGYDIFRSPFDYLLLALLRLLLVGYKLVYIALGKRYQSTTKADDSKRYENEHSFRPALKEFFSTYSIGLPPFYIVPALIWTFAKLLILSEHHEQFLYAGAWLNFGWSVLSISLLFPLAWYYALRTLERRYDGAYVGVPAAPDAESGAVKDALPRSTSDENRPIGILSDRKVIKQVLSFYMRHKKFFILYFLTIPVEIAIPLYLGDVLVVHKAIQDWWSLIILLALGIGRVVIAVLLSYVTDQSKAYAVHDMRRLVYRFGLRRQLPKPEHSRTAESIGYCLTEDCEAAGRLVSYVLGFLSSVLTFVGAFCFMIYFSPRLTLFVLSLIPLVMAATVIHGRYEEKMTHVEHTKNAKQFEDAKILDRLDSIRSSGAERLECRRFEEQIQGLFNVFRRKSYVEMVYSFFTDVWNHFMLVALLFYARHLIYHDKLSYEVVFPLVLYYQMFQQGTSGCFTSYNAIIGGIVAAKSVTSFVDRNEPLDCELDMDKDATGLVTDDVPNGPISFQNVNYAYVQPDGRAAPVLQDVSFDVGPGERVALMGESGCGKSTIAALLDRVYKKQGGAILLNDIDVGKFPHEKFHNSVSIVRQASNPAMFEKRTFRENITYGCVTQPDIAEVERAAKQANIHQVIMDHGGYDQEYDRGEQQRLAIARALVCRPKILILDEATSALDLNNERTILDQICQGNPDTTVISISQKLGGARNCNPIMVLDKGTGKVKEKGTHDELLKKKELYYHLYTEDSGEQPGTSQ